MGSGQEVVPVVRDHDSLVLTRGTKMHWIVLRQEGLGILRRANVETQSLPYLSTRVRNVLVDIEPSPFHVRALRSTRERHLFGYTLRCPVGLARKAFIDLLRVGTVVGHSGPQLVL